MIEPNLASRPFLNTRPVWLVTGVAVVLTVLFVVLNLVFFFSSSQTLAPQLARVENLETERGAISSELVALVNELDKVPWRSLSTRVRSTNVILREWGFSWLGLLDDIERVMPREVRIIKIAPAVSSDGVTLNLLAVARTRDSMLQFLENLISDPSFSQPIPLQEGFPERTDTAGYDLTLRVTYHPMEVGP